MSHPLQHLLLAAALIFFGSAGAHAADTLTASDTAKIEQITGLKGKLSQEESVFKVSKPRTTLKSRSISGQSRPSWDCRPGQLLRPVRMGKS